MQTYNELDTAAQVAVYLINGGSITVGQTPRRPKVTWQKRFAKGNSFSGSFRYPRPA